MYQIFNKEYNMKKHLSVYSSNEINKYGYRFSDEALENLLAQTWQKGTPMFISHDFHRLIGWSKPLGLYINSSIIKLYGISNIFENEDEKNNMEYSANTYIEKKSEISTEQKRQLDTLLKKHLSGKQKYMSRECSCVIDENIVSKILPNKTIDETNKRSLISINELEIIAPGVFEIDGYTVFAHRYFRRSLSNLNNLNDIFLKKLIALKDNHNLDVKIAIDPHCIGLKDTYKQPMELEYWWGPKFNDSLLDIPTGVTHYKANEDQRFFHSVSGTDFWWHKQNDIQSLECEEIRDIPSFGLNNDKYACRYVHSMIDDKTGLAFHLDGAVRIYDEDNFLERVDIDISKAGKNTEYVKLWRVDGEISLSLWKELLNDFYRDNHQVGEYLLGNKLEKSDNSIDNTSYSINLVDYVPEENGYELFLSYHKKEEYSNKYKIEVIDKNIEYSAIELLKLIKRDNKDFIFVSDSTYFIGFEDMDINYPLIMHRGSNAIELANKTMEYLYTLSKKYYEQKEDRVITIRIGIEYIEKIAIFSFVSNIASIYLCYKNEPIKFPNIEDLGSWCSKHHNFLSKNYDSVKNSESYLIKDGFFHIQRFFVNDLVEIDEKGILSFKVKEEQKVLAELIADKKAEVLPVTIIEKAICSNCDDDYIKCDCLVSFDKKCLITVEKLDLHGFIFTTRSSYKN